LYGYFILSGVSGSSQRRGLADIARLRDQGNNRHCTSTLDGKIPALCLDQLDNQAWTMLGSRENSKPRFAKCPKMPQTLENLLRALFGGFSPSRLVARRRDRVNQFHGFLQVWGEPPKASLVAVMSYVTSLVV
jgi:hypothetical protein